MSVYVALRLSDCVACTKGHLTQIAMSETRGSWPEAA